MSHPPRPRATLERLYHAAVAAADPTVATRRAVLEGAPPSRHTHLIAVGKAAAGMARGAHAALSQIGVGSSGVVISASDPGAVPDSLEHAEGDHPLPGPRSRKASEAIARVVARIQAPDEVLVLISGGTTSLIADPVDGVSPDDVISLFEALLSSGADIISMNALRKRVLRWGAGRLAAALTPARTRCLIVSDVIGNDLASIGSGPCVPDPATASGLLELIRSGGIESAVPSNVLAYLVRVQAGALPETPKPADPCFANVDAHVILDARSAVAGAAAAGTGVAHVFVHERPIRGSAAAQGAAVAERLLERRRSMSSGSTLEIWWGETTVQLPAQAPKAGGGRCQELALACASMLNSAGPGADGITVLAAGTDGRDGPTDAAGAIVDEATWSRIAVGGRDPANDLRRHASYDALQAADALFRPGPTGTNVNDIVLGLVQA